MTQHKLGDAAILLICLVGAIFSAIWGLDQAPREYGLLVVVCTLGVILMGRKLLRPGD